MRRYLSAVAVVLLSAPAWSEPMGPLEEQTPKDRIAHVNDLMRTIALASKVIQTKLKPCLAKAKGRDASMAKMCPGINYETLLKQLQTNGSKVTREVAAERSAQRKVAKDSNWLTYQKALGTPTGTLGVAQACESWVKSDDEFGQKDPLCPLKAMGALAVSCSQIATQCQELGRLGYSSERLVNALQAAPKSAGDGAGGLVQGAKSAPARPKAPPPARP